LPSAEADFIYGDHSLNLNASNVFRSVSLSIKNVAAALLLAGLIAPAHAANTRSHAAAKPVVVNTKGLLTPGTTLAAGAKVPVKGRKYSLNLYHLHTGESLNVVYRIGNTYLPAAMAKLNHFLRDHRTDGQSHYDPKEFDLLHNLMARLHKPNAEIDIVCGYRSPESNEFLRQGDSEATGVAKNSQHVQAKAIDIRVPGVQTRRLRDAALSLGAGGVGYYPNSQFVHVDVGPVRQWAFFGSGD
jgi:uncharacterized protein YcbK (DUF882 family)